MAGSTGILRSRLPVAAKIGLLIAGHDPRRPRFAQEVSPPHARCPPLCAGKI